MDVVLPCCLLVFREHTEYFPGESQRSYYFMRLFHATQLNVELCSFAGFDGDGERIICRTSVGQAAHSSVSSGFEADPIFFETREDHFLRIRRAG